MPTNFGDFWGLPLFLATAFWVFMVILAVWELVWKGIALWKAARNGHSGWYISILIFNTLGILPIIYVLGFSKREQINKTS